MWEIGINTWVWTSPLTDDGLAPKVCQWGFDVIELPVESSPAKAIRSTGVHIAHVRWLLLSDRLASAAA